MRKHFEFSNLELVGTRHLFEDGRGSFGVLAQATLVVPISAVAEGRFWMNQRLAHCMPVYGDFFLLSCRLTVKDVPAEGKKDTFVEYASVKFFEDSKFVSLAEPELRVPSGRKLAGAIRDEFLRLVIEKNEQVKEQEKLQTAS